MNASAVNKVVDFMVQELIKVNKNLDSTKRQRPTKSTFESVVSTVGLLLKLIAVILFAIASIWVLVWRVKSLLNKDESKKNSLW